MVGTIELEAIASVVPRLDSNSFNEPKRWKLSNTAQVPVGRLYISRFGKPVQRWYRAGLARTAADLDE